MPLENRAPTSLENPAARMIGRRSSTCVCSWLLIEAGSGAVAFPVPSTMMMVIETVERWIPFSIATAPMIAWNGHESLMIAGYECKGVTIADGWQLLVMLSSMNMPSAPPHNAPIRIDGRKIPPGIAAPYTHSNKSIWTKEASTRCPGLHHRELLQW